jgi:hypothetical protein
MIPAAKGLFVFAVGIIVGAVLQRPRVCAAACCRADNARWPEPEREPAPRALAQDVPRPLRPNTFRTQPGEA